MHADFPYRFSSDFQLDVTDRGNKIRDGEIFLSLPYKWSRNEIVCRLKKILLHNSKTMTIINYDPNKI